nr:MAG TPA_asm: NinG recombination protein [Caudoviricetes sp.]
MFDYSSANRRWRRLRMQALRRDGFRCQDAARYGRTVQAVTVHHIYPAEQFPEFAYCLWNLISLSVAAHNAMHDRGTDQLTPKGEALRRRTIPPSSL